MIGCLTDMAELKVHSGMVILTYLRDQTMRYYRDAAIPLESCAATRTSRCFGSTDSFTEIQESALDSQSCSLDMGTLIMV